MSELSSCVLSCRGRRSACHRIRRPWKRRRYRRRSWARRPRPALRHLRHRPGRRAWRPCRRSGIAAAQHVAPGQSDQRCNVAARTCTLVREEPTRAFISAKPMCDALPTMGDRQRRWPATFRSTPSCRTCSPRCASAPSAVLVAPPGAGKTTAVAPALLGEPWCTGQVILLSPRRVAARAAAERMAELLGEPVGRARRLPDPARQQAVGARRAFSW